MDTKMLYEKTLGALSMVAIGDALGMPAHDMTPEEITRLFGGELRDFQPPLPNARVHPELKAAQITDDTLLTLATAKAYIENQGTVTPEIIAAYTCTCYREARRKGLEKMFGPSTKSAVEALSSNGDWRAALNQTHPMVGSSNGAAMKISPAGLVHPGDIRAAVRDAVTICLPTHPTQTAVSAAAAVAAGLAEAMKPGAEVWSVLQSTLWGAREGERIGRQEGRIVPLPSVPKRIELALSLALKAVDLREASRSLLNVIGAGLAAYESIPTAIGLFAAANGDPEKCAIAGANVGFDTDTIASMAGALAGALRGFSAVPDKLYRQVIEVNHLDLELLARQLVEIFERGTAA